MVALQENAHNPEKSRWKVITGSRLKLPGTPHAIPHRKATQQMLAASAMVATSAWQARGVLRAELLTVHTSRAQPILAREDDLVFSRRKMEATLAEARAEACRELEQQAEQKASGSCASMPSLIKQSIVGYQLAWILGSLLLFAEASAHLVHAPPPVLSLLDPHLALDGVLVGVPGAVLVSRLERWRSDAAPAASLSGTPGAARVGRRQNLAEVAVPTLLLVFLPLRPFFPLFVETSGKQVVEEEPAIAAASLVGGALVGSAWTHGLLQVGWGASLNDAVPRRVRQSACGDPRATLRLSPERARSEPRVSRERARSEPRASPK